MFKNSILILIVCMFILNCKTSKVIKKEIYPIKGEIVFLKQDTVYNKKAYSESFNLLETKFAVTLKNQIVKERIDNNESIDTILLNKMVELSKQNLKSILSQIKFKSHKKQSHIKFQDSIIVVHSKNSNGKGNYKIINRLNNTCKIVKSDSITVFSNKKLYSYKDEKGIRIKEFLEDIKIINGFKCHKVVVEIPERMDVEDEEFSKLFEGVKKTYILYVTNKIKSKYHPVINYKTILDKYFPLEVIEKESLFEGFETKYKLIKIDLK